MEADGGRLALRDRITEYVDESRETKALWEDILRFYHESMHDASSEDNQRANDFLLSGLYRQRQSDALPKNIREEAGGSMVAIVHLIGSAICNDGHTFAWLGRIPLSSAAVRPLVDECHDCIPNLLARTGELRFVRRGVGRPLLTSMVQRILKIARETHDPKILRGALVTLSTSKFLKLAGAELALKMMRAEQETSGFSVRLISQVRHDNPDVGDKELAVINDITSAIQRSPEDYSQLLVNTAAECRIEHFPTNVKPLLLEEGNLKLRVREMA